MFPDAAVSKAIVKEILNKMGVSPTEAVRQIANELQVELTLPGDPVTTNEARSNRIMANLDHIKTCAEMVESSLANIKSATDRIREDLAG